ncbi:hypothetical protein B488_04670 [Liberibacter crescens BT-1]|uniref:Uncharacterized protein n=1 Tax=Liberibacter crescens (strain BT-1) TaxID=1215343 RepID=L0ESH6_LIBCB|nr:hypothetical protein [Liberibacter crescens]AGA64459.1 hypothetical protein B488_04670 [Liberibacter crescens BT-1]
MTKTAFIRQLDLQRIARVAKEEHVMCELVSENMTLRVYPEFIVPSLETKKEEEDFIL